jgi:hypothetical protein
VTARFGTKSPKARRLEIHEYTGIATASPLDATSTNSANGTTAANAITAGAVTTSVTAPVTNGRHMLTAVARDAAGNQTTSVPVDLTVTDGTDSTPPVISGVSVSSITAYGATITWTTDEPATSQVSYGPTAYGSTSPLDSTLVTSHTVSVSGLAGTTRTTSWSVRTTAGNPGLSSDVSWPRSTAPRRLRHLTRWRRGRFRFDSGDGDRNNNVGVVGVVPARRRLGENPAAPYR